jgi:hypothetical protein
MPLKAILRISAVLLAAVSFSSLRVAAQDDSSSVADAARRARQQKHDAAKPVHVIDNDTLAPVSSTSSSATPAATAPGPAPAATDTKNAAPAADKAAASSDTAKTDSANDKSDKADEQANNAEIEALQQQIVEMKAKVDLQQREIALEQDTYYSNPSHDADTAGKEKLDSMQSDLTSAKSQLADLLAKISALAPQSSDTKTPESAESAPSKP